jgi:hypothetical protein
LALLMYLNESGTPAQQQMEAQLALAFLQGPPPGASPVQEALALLADEALWATALAPLPGSGA